MTYFYLDTCKLFIFQYLNVLLKVPNFFKPLAAAEIAVFSSYRGGTLGFSIVRSVVFVHIVFTHFKNMFPELYLIAGNVDLSWVTNQFSAYNTRRQRHLRVSAYPVSEKSIIHHLTVFKYWGKIFSTIGKLLWKWNKLLASSEAPFLKLRLLNMMLLIFIIFQTHCTAFLALNLIRLWLLLKNNTMAKRT